MMRILNLIALSSLMTSVPLAAQSVSESAREIPLAYDVDVVVVGGTTRGVAAAQAAAKEGATVFLAAPRPYLGEDMCIPYRFWLEKGEVPQTDLAKAIFTAPTQKSIIPENGLKFSYEASLPSNPAHKDSKDNPLLTDGKASTPVTESVQYDGNVSIVADLGAAKPVDSVSVFAFQRLDDFDVTGLTVFVSDDKSSWQKVETITNPSKDADITLSTPINKNARYVRLNLEKSGKASRILIGEIVIQSSSAADTKKEDTDYLKVTTPMAVKYALDDALLKAGVDFLYGSYVTELLSDKNGDIAGIVMANRSGRQAVRAKVVIDATDRALTARMTKAQFSNYPAGDHKFTRIVVGGEPGSKADRLPVTYLIEGLEYSVHEYSFDLEMKDSSWRSFAKADQEARNKSWQKGQVAAAESIYQVPPDAVKAKRSFTGSWQGVEKLDLDALMPANVDYLLVLGPCADVSREVAARIARPLAGMDLGTRTGKEAASIAKNRSLDSANDLGIYGDPGTPTITAEVGEMLNGIRSKKTLEKLPTIKSPERALPVLMNVDTLVVGGGTGGAPAGIASARRGARTLVIEYLHGLGGVGTLGRISKYWFGNRVGFTAEVDKGVEAMSTDRKINGWDIEAKMEWYRNELDKAGGDVWFRSLGAGAVVKGNKFVGAVIVTPHGRGVVMANTVIDATGNAVVPACAGLPTQEITGEHISVQGTGLPSYTPGKSYRNSDWTFTDDDDVLDMWRIHVVARKKYKNFFDQGQLIDTRARRRIVGDVTVSPMDIINKRVFPDIITVAKSNFDNHGFSSHELFMVKAADKSGLVGNVPYRSLLPKDYDGILVTGLGMSAHGDAMPVLRMQADVQNQGYAAGTASAMAAEEASSVREIDVKQLQQHLADKGVIPEEYVDAKDSYPLGPERLNTAVQTLGEDYSGIAVVLAHPDAALPVLKKSWSEATDFEKKVRYAHVLGMMYDDTGSQTLIEKISNSKWDKGWNFRGMGQFGATTSQMDNLVIALGRTGVEEAVPVIIGKLKELTPASEFSHCRAVAVALEMFGKPEAAEPLADLLKMPGVMGHSFQEINNTIARTPASPTDNSTRNNSLRELILARALYRCGDFEGLGEKILKEYARDFRGHYARHAKAILREE